MNYKRMWSELKAELIRKSEILNLEQGAIEQCKQTLMTMNKIEAEEYKEDCIQDDEQMRADEITEAKISESKKVLNVVLESLTGKKVIDNLDDLKEEIRSKRGMPYKAQGEKIFVDASLEIPKEILREAIVHNVRIVHIGVDFICRELIYQKNY